MITWQERVTYKGSKQSWNLFHVPLYCLAGDFAFIVCGATSDLGPDCNAHGIAADLVWLRSLGATLSSNSSMKLFLLPGNHARTISDRNSIIALPASDHTSVCQSFPSLKGQRPLVPVDFFMAQMKASWPERSGHDASAWLREWPSLLERLESYTAASAAATLTGVTNFNGLLNAFVSLPAFMAAAGSESKWQSCWLHCHRRR